MDAAPNLVHNHVVNRLIGLILILALVILFLSAILRRLWV